MLSEKLIAVDFFDQKSSSTMHAIVLKGKIMQGLKRKVVYVSLFELFAIALTSSFLMLAAGHDASHSGIAAIASSSVRRALVLKTKPCRSLR